MADLKFTEQTTLDDAAARRIRELFGPGTVTHDSLDDSTLVVDFQFLAKEPKNKGLTIGHYVNTLLMREDRWWNERGLIVHKAALLVDVRVRLAEAGCLPPYIGTSPETVTVHWVLTESEGEVMGHFFHSPYCTGCTSNFGINESDFTTEQPTALPREYYSAMSIECTKCNKPLGLEVVTEEDLKAEDPETGKPARLTVEDLNKNSAAAVKTMKDMAENNPKMDPVLAAAIKKLK